MYLACGGVVAVVWVWVWCRYLGRLAGSLVGVLQRIAVPSLVPVA